MLRPILALALLAFAAPAAASETRHAGAHEHGHSRLAIAIEEKSVAMELEAPGADIVGFEHAPGTDEERGLVAAALARLRQPLALFALPAAAGCTVHEVEAELEQEGEHSAFHAHYHLDCRAPEAIDRIDFNYFAAFKGAREIDVTLVSAAGQKHYEVERAEPSLKLR